MSSFKLFDAHLHIIDGRFPLMDNKGYLPAEFTCADYLRRMRPHRLAGGAVVSGSFQGFDQTYLLDALRTLGHGFVGVTQLTRNVTDEQLLHLHDAGVRAVRFNIHRGGSEDVRHLRSVAQRVHEVVGWHVELYVHSRELASLYALLANLPAVSIDHLGLSREGLPVLLKLVERGVRVKASGFGRIDFELGPALGELYATNPHALMFGSDLPSTRSPRPYEDGDIQRVIDTLGHEAAQRVLCDNAMGFYRPRLQTGGQSAEATPS